MKRILCLLLSCLLLPVMGCSTGSKEKVNIIKGAGMANNSTMVSFNELSEGVVGGFLDNDNLLVARKNGTNYHFSILSASTASPAKAELPVVPAYGDFSLEMSPDGKQFICGNSLVNIQQASLTALSMVPSPFSHQPGGPNSLPSYSFAGKNEVLLTDPFYYMNKYYPTAAKGLKSSLVFEKKQPLILSVGDIRPAFDASGFRNIKAPDINFLKTPVLLADELKYVFIGGKQDTGESGLYVLDLFAKKFSLIDTGVKTYAVSPDRKTVAYVKRIQGDKPLDRIYTADTEGQEKKELAGLPGITGLCWSGSSQWLAYAGGEKSRNDLWIIRADGTGSEQLTHGMYARDRLAWSGSSDKIAFTTGQEGSAGESKVYVVTLNLSAPSQVNARPTTDSGREQMAQQVLQLLRKETSYVLSQNRKLQ